MPKINKSNIMQSRIYIKRANGPNVNILFIEDNDLIPTILDVIFGFKPDTENILTDDDLETLRDTINILYNIATMVIPGGKNHPYNALLEVRLIDVFDEPLNAIDDIIDVFDNDMGPGDTLMCTYKL